MERRESDGYESFPYWDGRMAVFRRRTGAISYEQAKAVVAGTVEAGINFFVTAAVYGRGGARSTLAGL